MNLDFMQAPNFVIFGYGYDSKTDHDQIAIDNFLGRSIAEGSDEAFDLFVRRWRGFVVNYARRRLFDKDIEDAQEIANDVFLHLREASRKWLSESRYDTCEFVRFFYGVMRLQTTWKLQQIGKRRKRAARDHNEFARTICTIDDFGYVDFENNLQDALLRLKPKTRLAFILRYVEGYRTNEVAKIMGISAALATYHHKTACKRLRKLLVDWR